VEEGATEKANADGIGNGLLDALPRADREALAGSARRLRLEQRRVLWEPHESVRVVHFPVSGVISLLTVTQDGSSVELATIGNEGMVGIAVFLGGGTRPIGRAVSQIPGETLAIDADRFEAQVAESSKLRELMLSYTHVLLLHVAQGVACNRLHPVEQRCARWLLTTRDRLGTDEIELTQEFLAQMLGVRRATVTETVRILQRAGLISSRRGAIRIEDRAGLEDASCECYRVVRMEYDRLLSRS
jgi:CRP-like cAMP-binding protein